MFKKHFNTIVLGLVSFVCASMVYMAYSSVGAQKADKERMTTELTQLTGDIKQTKTAYEKAKKHRRHRIAYRFVHQYIRP